MLIEKISDKEMNLIESLRNCAIPDSDFVVGDFASNDYFLRFWESNKMCLAAPFEDSLILKKHICLPTPEEEREEEIRHLVYLSKGVALRDRIENFLRNNMIDGFLSFSVSFGGLDFRVYEILHYYVFTKDSFLNNIYPGPTFTLDLANNVQVKFVSGMKLMKLLKRLSEAAGATELFEEVRIAQSKILNDNNLDTEICLSIHPIDYMTASYNNNNWSSCMNWKDGEYRRGVIEMMNSPCVVVAYIDSDKNTILGGEWGSKRWREFFIVNREMISGIKGYPYWNRDIESFVIDWLKELYEPVFKVEYSFAKPAWSPERERDIYITCGPAMYNDFYSDNEYHSIFSSDLMEYNLDYSGPSECVCCGERGYFDEEGLLYCARCVESYYCAECGGLITDHDDLIEFNGNYYCQTCFENLPLCDFCGAKVETCNGAYYSFYIGLIDKSSFKNTVAPICDSWGEPRMFFFDYDCIVEILKENENPNTIWIHNTDDFYGHVLDISKINKHALLDMISKEELQRCYKELNQKIKKSF